MAEKKKRTKFNYADEKLMEKRDAVRDEAIAQNPDAFAGIFLEAERNRKNPDTQTAHISAKNFAISTAESFIERFYENTGKMPNAQAVRDFLDSTVTLSTADQSLSGTLPKGALKTQFVDPYIRVNDADLMTEDGGEGEGEGEEDNDQTKMQELDKRLAETLGLAGKYGTEKIKQAYVEPKKNLANQLAQMGIVDQPQSLASTSQLYGSEASDIASFLSNLELSKGEATLDMSKFFETLGLQESQAEEGSRQFNLQYDLANRKYNTDVWNDIMNRNLAQELGLYMAKNQPDTSPTAFDWASLGISAIPGIGTLYNVGKTGYNYFKNKNNKTKKVK